MFYSIIKKLQREHFLLIGVCGFLLAIALTTDYHRAVDYLFSDEAVYYMMAQSLAFDQDLEYTRQDLQRVYEEGWYAGPQGVYLTKTPDGKIYYGKYLAYSLFLAPFIAAFGLKGFLLFNVLLLGLMIWLGWVYLRQFNPPDISLWLAVTFFLLSASFVYTFWLTPEVFNMFLVTFGLFLWLYRRDDRTLNNQNARRFRLRWLLTTPNGRLFLAPIPLAIAYASKITNILFLLPILADVFLIGWVRHYHRHLRRALVRQMLPTVGKLLIILVIFGGAAQLFLGAQALLTGQSNQYAGDRRMFIWNFPFMSETAWDSGIRHSNEDYWQQSFFLTPKTFLYNCYYYVVGRFTGVLPYFICALLALYYFVRQALTRTNAPGADRWRRWLLLLAILAHIGAYIVVAPINYHGGSGAFGNRFFLNIYPAFLFLITVFVGNRQGRRSPIALLVAWLIGALFLAQPVLNPFQTSYYPPAPAFKFPYRFLPVELTLINAIPTHVNNHLMQAMDDSDPRYRLYYFDENISDIGSQEWWVLGERTSEFAVLTDTPQTHLVVTLMNGAVPNQVEVAIAGTTQTVRFTAPNERRQLVFPLQWSMPYFDSSIYPGKIRSATGFVPKFQEPFGFQDDLRYLGCRVSLSFNRLDAGKVLLAQGQPQEAIRVLWPAAQRQPENIHLRYYLGKAYLDTGKIDAALAELQQCETLLPGFLADSGFPRVYEAEALQRQTGAVISADDASRGQMVAFRPETDTSGFMVFGPHVEFPPGEYQAVFHLRLGTVAPNQTTPVGIAAWCDVYSAQYRAPLNRAIVRADSDAFPQGEKITVATVAFSLILPTTLEFRVETTGYAPLAVDKIEILPRLTAQVYQTLAQAQQAAGATDEASQNWQNALTITPDNPDIQAGMLQTLLRLQRGDQALQFLQHHLPAAAYHSGLRAYLTPDLLPINESLPESLTRIYQEMLTQFAPEVAVDVQFDDQLVLTGYTLKPGMLTPGGQFTLSYYWQGVRSMTEDYTIFVHFCRKESLIDPEAAARWKRKFGRPVTNMFQHDHRPLYGAYPTSDWLPGERIREEYTIPIPADLQPGTYEIGVGVWNPFTGTRLQTADGKTKVTIGEIRIDD